MLIFKFCKRCTYICSDYNIVDCITVDEMKMNVDLDIFIKKQEAK